MTDGINSRHGERVIGRGLAEEGKAMIEVLASEKGGWTILLTRPDGHSCIIGSAEAWTKVPPHVGNPA